MGRQTEFSGFDSTDRPKGGVELPRGPVVGPNAAPAKETKASSRAEASLEKQIGSRRKAVSLRGMRRFFGPRQEVAGPGTMLQTERPRAILRVVAGV